MSEKQIKKRERGANYTPEEKTMLIDLISQFKYIVEDKRTGGHIINKKKEAWKAITIKYNSNCTTVFRQMDQLKALYDNMKQKSRKNVGENNKLEYMNSQAQSTEGNEIVTSDDLARALNRVKEDKVQIHKTGGGSWKPTVTDTDAKVLAIIQDQIEPLSNPYDSGAVYFKDHLSHGQFNESVAEIMELDPEPSDTEKIAVHEKEIETDISKCPVEVYYGDMYISSPSTTYAPTQGMNTTGQDKQDTNSSLLTTPSRVVTPARRKFGKIKDGQDQRATKSILATTPTRIITPARRKFGNTKDGSYYLVIALGCINFSGHSLEEGT